MTKRKYWMRCHDCGTWLTDSGYDNMPAVRAAAQKHLRDTAYECEGGFDVEFSIYVEPDSKPAPKQPLTDGIEQSVTEEAEEQAWMAGDNTSAFAQISAAIMAEIMQGEGSDAK